MKWTNRRPGFSMLMAISVIVIMAGISVLVLSLSGKITRSTTVQFQREQAMLLAKSYTEYAVMAITANDRTANCLRTIRGRVGTPNAGKGYRIQVQIAYIGNGTGLGDVSNCPGARVFSNGVITPDSPLNAIIDVYVSYKDPENTALWVTYHRRTLQKI